MNGNYTGFIVDRIKHGKQNITQTIQPFKNCEIMFITSIFCQFRAE